MTIAAGRSGVRSNGMRPYHSKGPSDKNPDGKDLTAQERVAYLREPRRPVFRSDLAGEDVTRDRGLGKGRVVSRWSVWRDTYPLRRREGHLRVEGG